MTSAASGKAQMPGNDRGTEPATLRSPDYPAPHRGPTSREPESPRFTRRLFAASAHDTLRPIVIIGNDWPEDSDGAERDIDFQYRRQLAGTAHLSRHDRLHTRRAIRLWRLAALQAVHERKTDARRSARLRRRLLIPIPT